MLFEEWEKGTDLHDYDEYKLAESLYNVMPNNFDKKKLYKLRLAMTKEHFAFLCSIASNGSKREEILRERNEKLSAASMFLNEVINTLKTECKMNVIEIYTAHMVEKAKKAERERILGRWEVINGNKHNNDQKD